MAYKKKRIPTVSLEKSILYFFLTSKVILQSRFQSSTEKWFTSDARLDLYRLISKSFESSKNPISESQMEFLINSNFSDDESRRENVQAEYEDILSLCPKEDPQVLISSLNDALRSQEVEELIMSSYSSLQSGDIEEAIAKLKQGSLDLRKQDAESKIVSLWDDTDDWVEEVNNRKNFPEKYAGIPTGYKKFDQMTGGLFPAELTVIFGLSGKGKSTLMKQIGVNVRKAGYNVLHCGNEEDLFQMRTKYTSVETGIKYSKWKRGSFTEEEMELWRAYKKKQEDLSDSDEHHGKLFIYNFPQQTDATMIERKLYELNQEGVKIDLVIVDYLDLMSSIKRAYNENDEGGRVTGDLKQIAINFHVPVLVCTQANTTAERQEQRERPFLTASDVFGTKRKVHSANTLVGIVNQTATVGAGERDEEIKTHRLVICVPKNRDGAVFTFRLIVMVETGQVIEDDGTDQAGIDQEIAAQEILEEVQKLDSDKDPEKQHEDQVKLRHQLENDVQSLIDTIPTSENNDEQQIIPMMEFSGEEPGITESLPDSEFFNDVENSEDQADKDDSSDEEIASGRSDDGEGIRGSSSSSNLMKSLLALRKKR